MNSSLLNTESDDRTLYRNQAAMLNAELANNIEESLQTAHPMLDNVVQVLQEWKQRWTSWCDGNWDALAKFDTSYTHSEAVGYTTQTLDQEVGCALSTAWVAAYGPVEQKVEGVAEVFDDIFRGIIAPQKRQDAIHKLRAFTSRVFPLGDLQTIEATFDIHDLQHADPLALLKAEFTRSMHQLAIMEAQLTQLQEEKEACTRSEDVKGAEERSLEAIQLMRNIISSTYLRHRDSVAAEEDVSQFKENVRCAKDAALQRIGDATQQNSDIKANAANDSQLLDAFLEQFEAESQEKAAAYAQRTSKFKAAVGDNTKQQIAVWDALLQAVQQLNVLAQAREEIVVAHTADTVQERQRLQHQAEVLAAAAQRKQELDAILVNAARALEYTGQAQQYVQKAEEAIVRSQYSEKLYRLQIEEALRAHDIYKRYAVASNSVLFRRDQRLENVRRLLRSTEFQIANALETLDTELPVYRSQLASLNATEVYLSNAVSELSAEIAEEQEKWSAMEAFLDATRVDFDPPSLLVQELKRDMMQHHVEAVDELTNKEQKLLDNEKASVRKMMTAVETAKEAFRDRSLHSSPSRGQQ